MHDKITPKLETSISKGQRLDYVDFLKGLAIFLMVMGHFLGWQWGGSIDAHIPDDVKYVTIVRDFIYSFHMPLFFFLSGYVFNMRMKRWYVKDLVMAITKRVRRLIIPGLSCMIICYYIREKVYFEWFLRTLFEIYLINAVIYYISQRFKHHTICELILQMLFYFLL